MPSLRRTDLFGFTPQDALLTAEEEFGGEGDLEDVPLFGFVPGGPELEEEMEYGFVPGGAELEDEMEYGEDDDGDADDAAADQSLAALEREMDEDEDTFGVSDPSLSPVGGSAKFAPALGQILLSGFMTGAQSVLGSGRLQKLLASAGKSLSDFVDGGDMSEIASALLADPGFGAWNEISPEEQQGLVRAAVAYAAIPGAEMSWDDEFWAAWQEGGIQTLPSDIVNAARMLFGTDAASVAYSTLGEVPAIGAMMRSMGFTPQNFDQQVNVKAMSLYLFGAVNPQIYEAAAAQVTSDAQEIIAAAQQGVVQGGQGSLQPDLGGGVTIEEEALVSSIQLPEPAQQLPEQGIGLPDPPQILAIGYAAAVAGSLLGLFS